MLRKHHRNSPVNPLEGACDSSSSTRKVSRLYSYRRSKAHLVPPQLGDGSCRAARQVLKSWYTSSVGEEMGRRSGQGRCWGIGLWCLLAVCCVRAAGGSEKLDRTCRGAPVRSAIPSRAIHATRSVYEYALQAWPRADASSASPFAVPPSGLQSDGARSTHCSGRLARQSAWQSRDGAMRPVAARAMTTSRLSAAHATSLVLRVFSMVGNGVPNAL